MRRTTYRRRRRRTQFYKDNRRLFPFAGAFLLGVALGVAVYVSTPSADTWGDMLRVQAVDGGFAGGMRALAGSCFSTVTLLCVLYLLGLWACGAPFVLAVPLFYGLGLGLTEAYYYGLGTAGIPVVAAVVMPCGLLHAAVLVMAGAESLRLSLGLSRQLLPLPRGTVAAVPTTGLWSDFRLYSLRFLLFLAAAVGVGLVEVLLRWTWSGILK